MTRPDCRDRVAGGEFSRTLASLGSTSSLSPCPRRVAISSSTGGSLNRVHFRLPSPWTVLVLAIEGDRRLVLCFFAHDRPCLSSDLLVENSLPQYAHIGFMWFSKRREDGEGQAYHTRSSSHQLLRIALYSFSVCRNPSSTHPSEMISDRFRV